MFSAERFPEACFVVAFYSDAPYEGEAACVLELPPAGTPGGVDRELLAACQTGDVQRACTALAAGANANTVDDSGHTPLHHAVARREFALVRTLVEAGANPNGGKRGSSPLFAAFPKGKKRRIGPFSERIENEAHFELLAYLVEHGADAKAKGRGGTTLLDLALAEVPFAQAHARWFIARGSSSRLMRVDPDLPPTLHRPLHALLATFDGRSPEELARLPDEVRVLAWLGCDPNERSEFGTTPVEEWLSTGYGEDEVAPGIVLGVARALVEAGARDEPDEHGQRPSGRAARWAKCSDQMAHYAEVARIFAAAGETHGPSRTGWSSR